MSRLVHIPHSTRCTLYDRKIELNSYDFLQIKRVHALLLSVSFNFKPIFVDFNIVIDMLALLQFSIAIVVCELFGIFNLFESFAIKSNIRAIAMYSKFCFSVDSLAG